MRIIFLLLFIASSLALLTLPLTKRKVSVARKFSSYFNEISGIHIFRNMMYREI